MLKTDRQVNGTVNIMGGFKELQVYYHVLYVPAKVSYNSSKIMQLQMYIPQATEQYCLNVSKNTSINMTIYSANTKIVLLI